MIPSKSLKVMIRLIYNFSVVVMIGTVIWKMKEEGKLQCQQQVCTSSITCTSCENAMHGSGKDKCGGIGNQYRIMLLFYGVNCIDKVEASPSHVSKVSLRGRLITKRECASVNECRCFTKLQK